MFSTSVLKSLALLVYTFAHRCRRYILYFWMKNCPLFIELLPDRIHLLRFTNMATVILECILEEQKCRLFIIRNEKEYILNKKQGSLFLIIALFI